MTKYAYGRMDGADRVTAGWEAQEALRASISDNGHVADFSGAVESYLSGSVFGFPNMAVVTVSGDNDAFWAIDARLFLSTGRRRLLLGNPFSSPDMAAKAWREVAA